MKALFPYAEQTGAIVVRVAVNFLPEQSDIARGRWFWAYHIRIENEGETVCQLLTRRWLIRDARGAQQVIEGEGVVGDQPVIRPGESYDYVSGCPLSTPSGSMVGSFNFIGHDGVRFDVAVPKFSLSAPLGIG